MRYLKNIIFLFLFLIQFSCDYWGDYGFKLKNGTSKLVELRFNDTTVYKEGKDTVNHDIVIIPIGAEKTIRIIPSPLNTPAHDCLHEHGMTYFHELIFDTYLDGKKVNKQIWQPENWEYKKISKYSAEYKMTLTDQLCE